MIRDKIDRELFFYDGKKLFSWLNPDSSILNDCILSIENCKSDKDYIELANEYILKENDGLLVHKFYEV